MVISYDPTNMTAVKLSRGALKEILETGSLNSTDYPVVAQILEIKSIRQPATYYRLVISDGEIEANATLREKSDVNIEGIGIGKGSYIKFSEFTVSKLPNQPAMILIKNADFTVPNNVNNIYPGMNERNISLNQSIYGTHSISKQDYRVESRNPVNQGYGNSTFSRNFPTKQEYMGSNTSMKSYDRNHGSIEKFDEKKYTPIHELNPYQNRWTIKARLTAKSDIRKWSNKKGEGCLMSIDLLDDIGGEVRGLFFNENAEKFNPILEVGKVYTFSGGRMKPAKKQFSSINHDYEITFNNDAEVVAVPDDYRIKKANLKLKKIATLSQVSTNAIVDVLAIVKSVSAVTSITTKNSTEVERRNLAVVDDSEAEISITLWGNFALLSDDTFEGNAIIAFKGLRVSDYGGCTLSTLNSSSIIVSPDIREAHELQSWWNREGCLKQYFTSLSSSGSNTSIAQGLYDPSSRSWIASIGDNRLGFGNKADYVVVSAYVSYMKHDIEQGPWYMACPIEGCSKKVTEEIDSGYRCEKCLQTYPNYELRYILSLTITDISGEVWATAFNDTAIQLLQIPANVLAGVRETSQTDYERIFSEGCWKEYVFKLRVKAETVNDEQRVKSTIISAEKLDFAKEAKTLVHFINKYL